MKKVAIIASVLALLLFLAFLFAGGAAWDGGASVQCRFHIVESHGMNPINNARIRVIREGDLEYLSDTNSQSMFRIMTTDDNGSATVAVPCGAGGSRNLFGRTGRIVVSGQIFVEADGYLPVSVALQNMVGGSEWRLSKRAFDIELILFKKP